MLTAQALALQVYSFSVVSSPLEMIPFAFSPLEIVPVATAATVDELLVLEVVFGFATLLLNGFAVGTSTFFNITAAVAVLSEAFIVGLGVIVVGRGDG